MSDLHTDVEILKKDINPDFYQVVKGVGGIVLNTSLVVSLSSLSILTSQSFPQHFERNLIPINNEKIIDNIKIQSFI